MVSKTGINPISILAQPIFGFFGYKAILFFPVPPHIYDGVIQMVAIINTEKCTGCETCVSECPASAIAMESDKAKVDKDMCVDCQTCVDVCPSEAITME